MKTSQFLGAMVVSGSCLLLASCIDSRTPLCSPEEAKPDGQLAGVWRTAKKDGSEVLFVHVGRAGKKLPRGIMRTLWVSHNNDGTLNQSGEMLAFPTSIGENHYLNVAATDGENLAQFEKSGWKPDLVEGYWLSKYKVEGDLLLVWRMDPDVKRRLIEAGKIKGTVDKGKHSSAYFTDTMENLVKLLSAPENANLFEKESNSYQRVK